MPLVRSFADGSFLEFDQGKFDAWCVYFTSSSGVRTPPRDLKYFAVIRSLAEKYGRDRIYSDFVSIYDKVGKMVDNRVFEQISEIASQYNKDDSASVDLSFSTLYLAMIAEENKQYTRLGRKIKRIGIYFLLYEDVTIEYAANFMCGKKWREIEEMCKQRGF